MGKARNIADSNLSNLTVDTNTLVIDATNNRVGVGTASPASQLQVTSTGATEARVHTSSTGNPRISLWAEGASYNYFETDRSTGALTTTVNSSERMRIDSSGNVGIGTNSPQTILQLGGASNKTIRLDSATGNAAFFGNFNTYTIMCSNRNPNTGVFVDTGKASGSILIDANTGVSNITFNTTTSNNTDPTERMRIDSSGNVGIGTSSPTSISNYKSLTINGTTGSLIDIASNGTIGGRIQCDTNFTGMALYALTNSPMVFGTNSTERMRIDSSGQLLVGTTVIPSGAGTSGVGILNLSGTSGRITIGKSASGTLDGVLFYNGASYVGGITYTNTSVSYNTSSDYRLKDNQAPLTGSGAFIDALQPKTWTWTADGSTGVGFIAHEVQAVSPDSVFGEKDAVDEDGKPKYQSMEYGSAEFIANIIAELQDLRKRVAVLESK